MKSKITDVLSSYPEFLTSDHIVQLGIYSSIDAAYQARTTGNSPEFIKLRHKVLYPKKSVIDFLEKRMRPTDSINFSDNTCLTTISKEN